MAFDEEFVGHIRSEQLKTPIILVIRNGEVHQVTFTDGVVEIGSGPRSLDGVAAGLRWNPPFMIMLPKSPAEFQHRLRSG